MGKRKIFKVQYIRNNISLRWTSEDQHEEYAILFKSVFKCIDLLTNPYMGTIDSLVHLVTINFISEGIE